MSIIPGLIAAQAQQFLAAKRPDLAIGEFKAILAMDPSDIAARGDLGTLLYFRGDYREAAGKLRAVVKQQPSLWKTVMLLGMCEKRLGNQPAARADLEQAFPQLSEEKLRVQAGMELTRSTTPRAILTRQRCSEHSARSNRTMLAFYIRRIEFTRSKPTRRRSASPCCAKIPLDARTHRRRDDQAGQ